MCKIHTHMVTKFKNPKKRHFKIKILSCKKMCIALETLFNV